MQVRASASLLRRWVDMAPGDLGVILIVNPRTDRIRKLVVESGPVRLSQWLDYGRDIRADYLKVFGEELGRGARRLSPFHFQRLKRSACCAGCSSFP